MDDLSVPLYWPATERAERFNQFFLTKSVGIRHELDSEIADGPSLDLTLIAEPLFYTLRPDTLSEILKVVRKSSSTSYCLDPWSTWLPEVHIHVIVPSITNTVNK